MTDRAYKGIATAIGASVGALVAYLLFTAEGREWRRKLEPAIEDAAAELNHFRVTVLKAAGVATEGWKLLNDALEGTRPEPRYGDPHQTTPF